MVLFIQKNSESKLISVKTAITTFSANMFPSPSFTVLHKPARYSKMSTKTGRWKPRHFPWPSHQQECVMLSVTHADHERLSRQHSNSNRKRLVIVESRFSRKTQPSCLCVFVCTNFSVYSLKNNGFHCFFRLNLGHFRSSPKLSPYPDLYLESNHVFLLWNLEQSSEGVS